ncbi:MAG: hypothetical protein JXB38_22485 [Anaerolineales bacterium]|nr:hypothetical protein [Anaerolineales bacterium]
MSEQPTPPVEIPAEAEKPSIELPPPNPVTRERHKREVRLQIILPFLAFVLLLVVLAVIFTVFEVGQVGTWAEISTIFLIVPVLIVSIIPLVLIVAVAYGVTKLLGIIPPYARLVQNYFDLGLQYVKRGANLLTEPFLKARSGLAVVDTLFDKFKRQ